MNYCDSALKKSFCYLGQKINYSNFKQVLYEKTIRVYSRQY